ncbi:aspartate 1-decarboxylase [Chloroflexota bacterium]
MRTMLKSKIHRAHVSETNINYENSITIDKKLIEEANVFLSEQVEILNLNNGAHFDSYTIETKKGSNEICMNGTATRLAIKGDVAIMLSYPYGNDDEARNFILKLVYVDANNAITKTEGAVKPISF